MPFHVRITQKSDKTHDEVKLDLTNEHLGERILTPYREGRPIVIGGKTIPPDNIDKIHINVTEETSDELIPKIKEKRRKSNVIVSISDEWYVTQEGKDVTDEYITGPPGSGVTQTQVDIKVDTKTRKVLSPEIEQTCHELYTKDKEFKRYSYPAIGIAISAVAALLAIPFVFTGKEPDLLINFTLWSMIVYFVIAIVITGVLAKKSRPYKISGYEKNVVRVYKAHQFLEKYQKDKLQSLLVSATNEIESLLYDIQNGWGNFSEKNPSFRSLVKPVEDFMHNIDFRLIPAMEKEENLENVKNIENSLSLMIKFFLSEKFEQITSINKELEKYPDKSEEEVSFKEKIRKHKHLVSILVSLAIIIGSGALASSTKLIKEDFAIEAQLLIWVGISVPFSIFWLRFRYQN